MNKKFEDKIVAHAESAPGMEVCGFVVLNSRLEVEVCPEKNENPDPSGCFTISPAKFLYYKLNKNVLGVYHSHPITTERPSKHDKLISEEMGLPYLIYSLKTKKFNLYYPESYEPAPLRGRPYIRGFYECSCLLKDYFKDNLDLNISKWNTNYWLPQKDKKANDLLLKILNKNTVEVKDKKIKKHDIIVFEIKEGRRLHVGLCCDTDMFLHQPIPTLSRAELLDARWQNKIKGVYRHPSLV